MYLCFYFSIIYAILKIEKAAVVCPTEGLAPLPNGDKLMVPPCEL